MSIARQSLTNLLVTLCVVLLVALGALLFKPEPPATVPRTKAHTDVPLALPVAAPSSGQAESEEFQELDGVSLSEAPVVSADTFRLRVGGKEHVFCLYFIEALENTFNDLARIKQQAAFFTGATHEAIVESGRHAVKEAAQLLGSRPLKVWTRWQKVQGTDRYFAIIAIELEKGRWTYLDEVLVGKGLAQPEGKVTPLPDGKRTTEEHLVQLRKLARAAREQRLGIWSRIR